MRRGNRRSAWTRPVLAGVIALLLLLVLLLALDRIGGHVTSSDAYAAAAIALLAGAFAA